jgi:hypothetical protein
MSFTDMKMRVMNHRPDYIYICKRIPSFRRGMDLYVTESGEVSIGDSIIKVNIEELVELLKEAYGRNKRIQISTITMQ